MNLSKGLGNLDVGWEGSKSESVDLIKLHHVDENPIPQECFAEDKSESESIKGEFINTTNVFTVEGNTGEFSVTGNGEISEVPSGESKIYLEDSWRGIIRQE